MGKKNRARQTVAPRLAALRLPDFDLRSVGLFRILLGLTLIYDLLLRKFPYVPEFYSDGGVFPIAFNRGLYGSLSNSPLSVLGSEAAVYVFFGLALVTYVLFTAGYRARLTGAVAFVFLWSMHQRNPFITYGVDQIMSATLFWSLFLPLGARFRLWKASGEASPDRMRPLAVVAMLLQISIIYLAAGLSKSGETWWNGTAISLAMTDTLNTTSLSPWLASKPAICTALTYATLAFELTVVFLLFSPWYSTVLRVVAGALILAFNWGLAPFLFLGPFFLMATVHFALLIPPSWWNRIAGPETEAQASALRYDGRPAWRRSVGNWVLVACMIGLLWSNVYPFTREGPLSGFAQRSAVMRSLWPRDYPWWEYSSIMNQDWQLFAPDPYSQMGWVVIAGETAGGEYRDLLTGTPLSWTLTPEGTVRGDYREVYGTERPPAEPRPHETKLIHGVWRDFADNMRRLHATPEWRGISDNWMAFEARAWERRHPEMPLRRVDVLLIAIDGYEVLETGVRRPELYLLHQSRPA